MEIDQETKLLRGGLLAALGDGQAAGHIHGDRLGQVNVLAGVHGGGGLLRMEIGRAFDHHRVELLLQQLAVAGEPGVALSGRDVEFRAGLIHPLLKVIRRRNEVITAVLWNRSAIHFPRPPQPIRPMLIFELASAPRTSSGFNTLKARTEAPVPAMKRRRVMGEVAFDS